MRNRVNIVELADQLLADAAHATKTAAEAPPASEPTLLHPVVAMLKQAAAALRAQDAGVAGVDVLDGGSMESVSKLASAISGAKGVEALHAGAGIGKPSIKAPASLTVTNTGVTATGGGATPSVKISTELRKFAQLIREQGDVVIDAAPQTEKTAHLLNAACGLHRLMEGLS